MATIQKIIIDDKFEIWVDNNKIHIHEVVVETPDATTLYLCFDICNWNSVKSFIEARIKE